MLVIVGVSWDLNWFLQLLFSVIVVAVGVHIFVKATASKYFVVDANFEGDQQHALADAMPCVLAAGETLCAVCATRATKKCSRCKAVRYCSQECQQSHWKSGHKMVCKDFHDTSVISVAQNGVTNCGFKASDAGGKSSPLIALIPGCGTISRPIKQAKDVIFFCGGVDKFMLCALLTAGVERKRAILRCLVLLPCDDVPKVCNLVKKTVTIRGKRGNM